MAVVRDPFDVRMIFLRVGWMDRYRGISSGDSISGGGAYVEQERFGHELFNFLDFRGHMYGYVQPPRVRDGEWDQARIDVTRLGASPTDTSLPGVLAVWVATAPSGGGFVVGWYRDATVFRDHQPMPVGSKRVHEDKTCGYHVRADSANAVLLKPDERVFPVPQKKKGKKGTFGQSNIWYAGDRTENKKFRERLLRHIATKTATPVIEGTTGVGVARQADPEKRVAVERAAVVETTKYFEKMGYRIRSMEKDNVGWDLMAETDERELRLEVKGLSGKVIAVELTPNEYQAMQTHCKTFRLCVVTAALTAPKLHVFAYSRDSGRWQTGEGVVLKIQESVAARCSAY